MNNQMYGFVTLLVVLSTATSEETYRTHFDKETYTLPCSPYDTINITDGITNPNGSITYDGVTYSVDHFKKYNYIYTSRNTKKLVENHIRGCVCLYKACVRSCCAYGEIHPTTHCQVMGDDSTFSSFAIEIKNESGSKVLHDLYAEQQYELLYGSQCDGIVLWTGSEPQPWYYYQKNNQVLMKYDHYSLTNSQFCIVNDGKTFRPLLCFDRAIDYDLGLRAKCFPFGIILAVVLLLITSGVYIFIKQLRQTMHGKLLLFYCLTLMMEYLCFTRVKYFEDEYYNWDVIVHLKCTCVLSTFIWTFVMNLEVWRTLRNGINNNSNTLVFLYVLVGWAVPFIAVFMMFTVIEAQGIEKLHDLTFSYLMTLIVASAILNIIQIFWSRESIRRARNTLNSQPEGDLETAADIKNEQRKLALHSALFHMTYTVLSMKYIVFIEWPTTTSMVLVNLLILLHSLIIFRLLVWTPKVKCLILKHF